MLEIYTIMWEPTQAEEDVRKNVVRGASPIRHSNCVFSFLHKTLQEYHVSHAIVATVERGVRNAMLRPSEIINVASQIAKLPDFTYDRHGYLTEADLEKATGGFLAEGTDNGSRDGPTARQIGRPIMRLCRALASSPLQTLELAAEEAARDFLADVFLENLVFARGLEALLADALGELRGVGQGVELTLG